MQEATISYEEWLESLNKEQLEEAKMLGGGDNDIALMRAYYQTYLKEKSKFEETK